MLREPNAKTRRKIVAAVEAAGIGVRNDDAHRKMIAETGRKVSLNARGVLARAQESMWRWPERWDNRPPPPPKQFGALKHRIDIACHFGRLGVNEGAWTPHHPVSPAVLPL